MLCPNGTVKPFLVSLVEPVAKIWVTGYLCGTWYSRRSFTGSSQGPIWPYADCSVSSGTYTDHQ